MIVQEPLPTPSRNLAHAHTILCRLTRECKITPSLRDGLLFLTYSRHFVPGYHRAVPPGRERQTAIKLTLMGWAPQAINIAPFQSSKSVRFGLDKRSPPYVDAHTRPRDYGGQVGASKAAHGA
jgi:hypothetical protein